MKPAYTQQGSGYPTARGKPYDFSQGSNLHGACQNLALKLNAAYGAPLDNAESGQCAPTLVSRRVVFSHSKQRLEGSELKFRMALCSLYRQRNWRWLNLYHVRIHSCDRRAQGGTGQVEICAPDGAAAHWRVASPGNQVSSPSPNAPPRMPTSEASKAMLHILHMSRDSAEARRAPIVKLTEEREPLHSARP